MADGRIDGGGRPAGRGGSGWGGALARFKAASAARVRSAPAAAPAGAGRIADNVIADARSVDPTPFLEAAGYTVRKEGRHLSVRAHGDECFRITRKPDGHFVACDNYETGIGDNVALVQHITGCGFAEAIHQLTGSYAVDRVKLPQPRQLFPTLPPETADAREQGTAYLTGRRITLATILEAVKASFLRFVGGGVVFTGLDPSGRVRAATKRLIDPSEPIPKRDFLNSDKRFPPVLPGNPLSVWIVEGGVDALALHDLAKQRGQQVPTVIVSGGAGVRGYLETPHILQLLKQADRITVAGEHEKDPVTQAKVNAQRIKLLDEIKQATGKQPDFWMPPAGAKDIAEHFRNEQLKLEAAQPQTAENARRGPRLG